MFSHEYLFSISLPSPPQSLPPGFFLVNPLHAKSSQSFLSEIEDMDGMQILTSEEDGCNSDWDKDHSLVCWQQIA